MDGGESLMMIIGDLIARPGLLLRGADRRMQPGGGV